MKSPKVQRFPVIFLLVAFLFFTYFLLTWFLPALDFPHSALNTSRPLTRQELGYRTWSYLHTMATNYPLEEGETEEEKLKIIFDFLQLFGKIYPCSICGGHFREMIKESPPPLKGTRADFEIWLCEVQFIQPSVFIRLETQ